MVEGNLSHLVSNLLAGQAQAFKMLQEQVTGEDDMSRGIRAGLGIARLMLENANATMYGVISEAPVQSCGLSGDCFLRFHDNPTEANADHLRTHHGYTP